MANDTNTLKGRTLLEAKSAKQVLEEALLSDASQKKLETQPVTSSLLSYVQCRFTEADNARETSGVQELLYDSLRRRKGEYSPSDKAKYERQNEPILFVPVTETKCNAAEAWMGDVLAPHGDQIWSINPTPLPDLSEEVLKSIRQTVLTEAEMEIQEMGAEVPPDEILKRVNKMEKQVKEVASSEARDKAKAMTVLIQDQLMEGNWPAVFKDFLSHLVTFGTGILKGPVVRNRRKLTWEGQKPVVSFVQSPQAEAVNPLDFFPSPDASNISDGYMIERSRLTRSQLNSVKNLQYYQKAQIEELVTSVPNGQEETDDNSSTRKDLEDKAEQSTKSDNEYTVYEFWGPVPGEHLKNWGITSAKDGIDYEFQVMWSGNYILKVMANPDPLNRRPYHKATFKRTVGSFWGRGVPQLMRGSQDRANAAIRSLITNMGMASGPQAVVDVSRLAKGERVTDLFPRRVWQTTNEFNLNAKPVDFMIIPSNAGELQAVYDRAVKDADTESGVPAYNYGSDQMSGPARTVGGLSILMNAAARGIKEAFSDIDQNAINPLITRFYVWNMLYSEDEAVKGDLNVVAKGASGMLLRELQLQKLTEFMDRTNNPLDQQILGIEGRAGLLRKQAKLLNLDTTDIVPSEEEMEKRVAKAQQEQAQQQAMMQGAGGRPGGPPQPPGPNLQGTQPRDETL